MAVTMMLAFSGKRFGAFTDCGFRWTNSSLGRIGKRPKIFDPERIWYLDCGTPEPQRQNGNTPVHPVDQCAQQEVGKITGPLSRLWMTSYNFCRVHRSIRMAPAIAAGITGRIRKIRDLLEA